MKQMSQSTRMPCQRASSVRARRPRAQAAQLPPPHKLTHQRQMRRRRAIKTHQPALNPVINRLMKNHCKIRNTNTNTKSPNDRERCWIPVTLNLRVKSAPSMVSARKGGVVRVRVVAMIPNEESRCQKMSNESRAHLRH